MALKYGGMAWFNSVNFHSDNYKVTATLDKNGKITTEIKEYKDRSKKFTDSIYKIPFIRGAFIPIQIALNSWKVVLVFVAVLILLTQIAHYFGLNFNFLFSSDSWFLLSQLILMIATIRFTPLGRFHGAEHMVSNSYEKDQSLSLSDITKQSRIHRRCGTNLTVFFGILFLLFYLLSINIVVAIILSCSIAFEIFIAKGRMMNILTAPFYWIGYGLQFTLFTAKPNEQHLVVARKALQELLELEKQKYKK